VKEADFTRYIMGKLPRNIYKWKIMNVMQNGVPDCYFSGSAGDLWIEVKYLSRLPKKPDTKFKINVSELQNQWLTARSNEGRNVAVILGSKEGCRIFDQNDWSIPITRIDLIHTRADIVEWITRQTLG
jgi:hypothetical protein